MNLPTIQSHIGVLEGDVIDGESVFVVGTGPSLCGFDWKRLEGKVTIALNDAVRFFAPTYHLFADTDIWPRYKDLAYAEGTCIVCQKGPASHLWSTPGFHHAKHRLLTFTQRGPDVDPGNDELWCSYSVATAGIQLAWKLGAHIVYLLGCDAYCYDTLEHCYDREGKLVAREPTGLPRVIEPWHSIGAENHDKVDAHFLSFGYGPPGGVYNLSARSTIRAWPKKKMEEVL